MAVSGQQEAPRCTQCGASSFHRTYIAGVVEHEYLYQGRFRTQSESDPTENVDEWECTVCGTVVSHGTYLEEDLNNLVEYAEKALPTQK